MRASPRGGHSTGYCVCVRGGGTLLRAKAPLENPPGLVSNLTPLTLAVGPSIIRMFCADQSVPVLPTSRTTELRTSIWAVPVVEMKAPSISADPRSKWLLLTSRLQPLHPKNPPSIPPVMLIIFESTMVTLLWPSTLIAPPKSRLAESTCTDMMGVVVAQE